MTLALQALPVPLAPAAAAAALGGNSEDGFACRECSPIFSFQGTQDRFVLFPSQNQQWLGCNCWDVSYHWGLTQFEGFVCLFVCPLRLKGLIHGKIAPTWWCLTRLCIWRLGQGVRSWPLAWGLFRNFTELWFTFYEILPSLLYNLMIFSKFAERHNCHHHLASIIPVASLGMR